MDVTANLKLSAYEKKELAHIVDCRVDDLDTVMAAYATAALREHVTMFLGQKVFTRGSDLMEYRLFLLVESAFDGRIPDEQEVCKLFQLTSTAARALIRAVMSKYQYQLKGAIEKSAGSLLNSAEKDTENNCVTVSVHNLNLVDELNRELADIDTSLAPVQKKRGSVATYNIQRSSYARLCNRFGVTSKIPAE